MDASNADYSTPVSSTSDWELYKRAIEDLKGDIISISGALGWDANVRGEYSRRIQQMAGEIEKEALAGNMTWEQAASQANAVRNTVLDQLRGRSTPIGRAIAEALKKQGKTLNEILAKRVIQNHGATADFNKLSTAQQEAIFAQVVKSAGKSNVKVNFAAQIASRAGVILIALSVAISVYTIATADDKVAAAKRELVVTGAGIAGSMAAGAVAGLACGPGAPVCVTLFVFAAGAAAAWGADAIFF